MGRFLSIGDRYGIKRYGTLKFQARKAKPKSMQYRHLCPHYPTSPLYIDGFTIRSGKKVIEHKSLLLKLYLTKELETKLGKFTPKDTLWVKTLILKVFEEAQGKTSNIRENIDRELIDNVLKPYAKGRYDPQNGDPKSTLDSLTNIAELLSNLLAGLKATIGVFAMLEKDEEILLFETPLQNKLKQVQILEEWLLANQTHVLEALKKQYEGDAVRFIG